MSNPYFAIIVAGGSGKRMNSAVPKQFLLLNGKPVIMHTIEKFYLSSYQPRIILVLSESDQVLWKSLVNEFNFSISHEIVNGGRERFFSVKNGLDFIAQFIEGEDEAIVAIHDAVRPLVSIDTIDRCFRYAISKGNAIASVPSRDSVRIQNNDGNKAVTRESVYLIQTPQTFNYKLLNKSYLKEYNANFTDDASVVEANGFPVFIAEGDQFNIKITFPEDIILAEAFLKNNERT